VQGETSTLPTPPPPSLDRHLIRGIAWTGGAKYIGQLVRWASTLVVVRTLAPEDYGIFGMAMVLLGLVALLTEFGVGTAVVALRDLGQREVRQLNALAVLLGCAACVATSLFAWPLALFYDAPELAAVVPALSLGYPIRALGSVPHALLQKELRFRLLAFLEAAETVIVAALVVLLALSGFGYWTLVAGNLAGGAVATLLLLRQRRPGFLRPRLRDLRGAVAFTGHVVTQRLTWFFYSNADFVVAGRLLGKSALGAYTFAFELASLPIEKVTALVGRVTPAFFAAVQHDAVRLRRYLLSLTEGIAFVTIPACWGLGLVTDTLVPVVLGERWSGVVVPLRILAAYAAWRSVETLFHQVLVVTGEARFGMRVGLLSAVVLPLAFLLGARWGTVGVALGWVLVHPLVFLPLYRRVLRRIGLTAAGYLGALVPAASCSAGMVAAVLLVRPWATEVLAPALRLAVEVVLGACVYAGAMLGLFGNRIAAFRAVLAHARGQMEVDASAGV